MTYRMEIVSEEPTIITRRLGSEDFAQIKIEVENKYVCDPVKPTTIKARKSKGRIVEVLGFIDNFSPVGAIVKYLDNNRRGLVNPCDLMPYEENKIISSEYVQDDLTKLKQIMELEFNLINQGHDEGEFTCPFCGGKASFRLYPNPMPDGPNNKRIASQCENGCFQ